MSLFLLLPDARDRSQRAGKNRNIIIGRKHFTFCVPEFGPMGTEKVNKLSPFIGILDAEAVLSVNDNYIDEPCLYGF